MKRNNELVVPRHLWIGMLMLFFTYTQGASCIQVTASGGGTDGSGSVTMSFGLAKDAALNSQIAVNGASLTPTTSVSGPTKLFQETHGVTDNSGKSAQVSVRVVNAPNGLTYDSKVLPYEGTKISTQPYVSAEQWLTVPKADSITCTESASYGSTTTGVSLDKAISVDGYYGKAYASDKTVSAIETGHVTGPFVGTANVDTKIKTRTPNYGSEFDLTMTAIKGSAPTGTVGYYINPNLKLQSTSNNAQSLDTINAVPGTLQSAINDAQSGDIINAVSGTYKENVRISKSLTIMGAGPGKTILDGTQAGSVATISGGTVALNCISITKGKAEYGAGILNNGGSLSVTGCTIYGNIATKSGGGVYNSNNGILTVTGSSISGNYATNSGGGIWNNGGTLTVSGSNINGNVAASNGGGGGGILNSGGILTVTGSGISGNGATSNGGGIYSIGGTIAVRSSIISGNTATVSGGIFNNGGTLTVTSSNISGNRAASNGGGILNNLGTLTVTGSVISKNTLSNHDQDSTKQGDGAGILNNGGKVLVSNSKLFGNIAGSYGGGISNHQGTMTVNGCTISGNAATWGGGGIINDGTMAITGGSITGNRAQTAAGGVLNAGGTMTITGSTISGNTANTVGGGIVNSDKLTVAGSTISGNRAASSGGGVFNNGISLNLGDSTISGNTAIYGGGIFNDRGKSTVTNCIVSGNTAASSSKTSLGGGIYNAGTLVIAGTSQIINNQATNGWGAGIYSPTNSATLFDGAKVIVKYNKAHFPTSEPIWYRGFGLYLIGTPTTTNGFNPTTQVAGNTHI